MTERYSTDERDRILSFLVAEAQENPEFVGCVLVGSGAAGFTDEYSDIDIVMVADDELDVYGVSENWRNYLFDCMDILGYNESLRADRVVLHNFYLKNYLEINCCIYPLELLIARREKNKVLFDKTGRIQDRLDETWAERKSYNPLEAYLVERQSAIWHYVNHAFVAIRREHIWQTLSDIEEIRNQIIHLHAYRKGLEPKRNRDVDKTGSGFQKQLALLHPTSLAPIDIQRSLISATRMFFAEVKDACREYDWKYDSEKLEAALIKLVEF